MKILITEEQSRMLINHTISEQENIKDMEKVKKLINKEPIKPNTIPKSELTDSKRTNHQ